MIEHADAGRRAEDFRTHAPRVTGAIGALLPTERDVSGAIRKLACCADPWAETELRAELTVIVAKLTAATQVLLGLCGHHDLLTPESNDLARGLKLRGAFDNYMDDR